VRRCIVLAGLMVFLLLIFVLAGCEMLDLDFTMDFDYRTTVETSGDIIQEIRVEITGGAVTTLEEAGFLDDVDLANDLEQEGWEVDIETTDDSLIINATGSYILDEDGDVAQVEGGPEVPEGFSVRVENGFLSKKYFAELDVAESGTGEIGELAQMRREDIFDFSWTITLPGEIVDSNADTVEGDSATWDFDYDSLTSGLYLTVQSQYTNWPVIGGIIAGAAVVLALVVFFVIKRRRRSSVSFTSDIVD
jgi:hypothetical protein